LLEMTDKKKKKTQKDKSKKDKHQLKSEEAISEVVTSASASVGKLRYLTNNTNLDTHDSPQRGDMTILRHHRPMEVYNNSYHASRVVGHYPLRSAFINSYIQEEPVATTVVHDPLVHISSERWIETEEREVRIRYQTQEHIQRPRDSA
jgi:hypothetical protein